MGPSIIFDKSAIQSLGQQSIYEVSRYFHTVYPPVLLYEILADLALIKDDPDASKKKVAELANKVMPSDSITNIHYQPICIHNLLGIKINMDRRPLVGGAREVISKDGKKGNFIPVQPENEAVLRWRAGEITQADRDFAVRWRQTIQSFDLEGTKKNLPKPPMRIRSLEDLKMFVDNMLAEQDSQIRLLDLFLVYLQCKPYIRDWIHHRWSVNDYVSINEFAPYAFHCLRVQMLFCIGMSHGILGTKPTNAVDVEYLYYTPFAYIFCSGDKLHEQLAPLVLKEDQSFVKRDTMHQALKELVEERKESSQAEPNEQSLIKELWIKHWGRFVPQTTTEPVSAERSKKILEELKPMMEAIQEESNKASPQPRFPV
ncbi:MAG: hypothetical protein IH984_13800 [Planctomycetes bacterium]|nr:hypothetical protein [Planctomycetota bacterium]